MKRGVWTFVLCVALTVGWVAGGMAANPPRYPMDLPSAPGEPVTPRIEPDQIVIKLTADVARTAVELPEVGLPIGIAQLDSVLGVHRIAGGQRMVREHGVPIKRRDLFDALGLDRTYVLKLERPEGEADVWKLVHALAGEPWVEYAEPVYLLQPTAMPNDTEFPTQWAHVNTGQNVNGVTGTPDADADTDAAWDIQTGALEHIVAVLDTGADLSHPDLIPNLVPGYDFVNDDPLPNDTAGHGTGACGIAAARGNNGIGVAGVCWNCGLMPLKVSNSVHEADAMRFAADNGAHAYNMSHTFGASWIQGIIDATEYATALGSLGFASATNSSGYSLGTPAAYEEVVPVGGSNSDDVRVYAYSDVTDITAPGPNTRSTALGGGYTYFGGTSSSSPFAAGLATLLRSQDPSLNVHELRYLLRVSCDDQVGSAEDTPGWDQFMGYGRVNADKAFQMIGGPWMALDRPHYFCGGELKVAVKDTSAGATVQVTLTGNLGADSETVTALPVAGANGYYEGTIPLAWAGKDGPVTLGDGVFDVTDGETIDATDGVLAATAFMDCTKKVCQWERLGLDLSGDCDQDRALDPGELWTISPAMVNIQTEPMEDVQATLSTTNPDVMILKDTADFGRITPFSGGHAAKSDAFRVQLAPGAPADQIVDFEIAISGRGFESDSARCLNEEGLGEQFSIVANRDLGAPILGWNFDTGTPEGFKTEQAHGFSDLSECAGTWTNDWNLVPATDRAHSGTHSMRLGNGLFYSESVDAALKSPPFVVPAGGGAVSFFTWMDSAISTQYLAWDGLVVEAKRLTDSDWTYLPDGTYDSRQIRTSCTGSMVVPFGYAESVDMIAGDGTDPGETGDTFDAQHQFNLAPFAGEQIQVRFRFGSHDSTDPGSHGTGTWIDTVAIHDPFVSDTWSGAGPQGLQGSDAACPTSFDLSWDAVAGSGDYEIFRSEVSCADALAALTAYDTSPVTSYSDSAAVEGTTYFYAVGGTEAASGCPTVRTCIQGACAACVAPPSPSGLLLGRVADDVKLTWSGSGAGGASWNVYRDTAPDPSTWGGPLATSVADEDLGTPGIQYTDVGGIPAGTLQHYLITEVTCSESPLR